MADGVLAVVNNSVITRGQVDDFIAPAIDALRREYATQENMSNAFEQKVSGVLNDGLERSIERQLILHEFDTEGYKMPDSLVDEIVQERIREQFGDRITLHENIAGAGHHLRAVSQTCARAIDLAVLRYKNVSRGKIVISPYKIENYYLAHQDEFKVEDQSNCA